jgi:hypothetical protein
MAVEKKPLILNGDHDPKAHDPNDLKSKDPSFDSVLDSACERLWDKHTQYSIRRIKEMDEELARLEKELDQFLGA